MKKMSLLLGLMALSLLIFAQENERHLWGTITIDSLKKEPYSAWFTKNYNDYHPNGQLVEQLKKIPTKDLSIRIFMGTWCGDTKRELPKLIKVLDAMNFPQSSIKILALSSKDEFYKQSKNREEKGYHVFRVPTFVIERQGFEVNRIVELPVFSMESDLLTILSGQAYAPQYKAYPIIVKWLKEGQLLDGNVLASSLAAQIKTVVASSAELNACGYVLMADGKIKEAVRIFGINANLFPEVANVWHSLAEGCYLAGEKQKAIAYIERGLQYAQQNVELIKEFLNLHQKLILQ